MDGRHYRRDNRGYERPQRGCECIRTRQMHRLLRTRRQQPFQNTLLCLQSQRAIWRVHLRIAKKANTSDIPVRITVAQNQRKILTKRCRIFSVPRSRGVARVDSRFRVRSLYVRGRDGSPASFLDCLYGRRSCDRMRPAFFPGQYRSSILG